MTLCALTAENAKSCAGLAPFKMEKWILTHVRAAAYAKRSAQPKTNRRHSAIQLEDQVSGSTLLYHTSSGIFSTAELKIGSGASGRLVSEVRARLYSAVKNEPLVILDGSPGIGCPVIASITGVSMVLIVAEPTLSGIHDMKRIVENARRFGTKIAVCVNKYDISAENTKAIEKFCRQNKIADVGRIPFEDAVIQAVNSGKHCC